MLADDIPTPTLGREGRRFERFKSMIQVSVTSGHTFWTGLTQNVSSGGLFLASEVLLPVGASLEFAFQLDPDPMIYQLRGVVRWVRTEEMSSEGLPAGMGVQFLQLQPDLHRAIDRFIQNQRDSLYFEDDDDNL